MQDSYQKISKKLPVSGKLRVSCYKAHMASARTAICIFIGEEVYYTVTSGEIE